LENLQRKTVQLAAQAIALVDADVDIAKSVRQRTLTPSSVGLNPSERTKQNPVISMIIGFFYFCILFEIFCCVTF